jgi:hypothetical protein
MAGPCEENGSWGNAKKNDGRLFTGRRKGRPRLRWMDDVLVGLSTMRMQRWMEKTEDRQQWRLVVNEAKAHPRL